LDTAERRRYVALLRGINVGGHRVKMDRLRALFRAMGFDDVSTFIASGNVLFSTEGSDRGALRDGIARHLAGELGYEVPTFLRTPDELAEIASRYPVEGSAPGADARSHYVVFLHEPASKAIEAGLGEVSSEMDTFEFAGREVHWLIRGKLSESPLFGQGLERAMGGVPTTTRNMNTLRRLVAKTAAGPT
jgi:uncharacterized protein (DUF1697 family)